MIPRSDPKIEARAIELIRATTPHKKANRRVILSPIPEFLFARGRICPPAPGLAGEAHGKRSRRLTPETVLLDKHEESGSANSAHGHGALRSLKVRRREFRRLRFRVG